MTQGKCLSGIPPARFRSLCLRLARLVLVIMHTSHFGRCSKITGSQRCDVPARIVQGGEGGKAHSVKSQKKWEHKVVRCC